VTGAAAPRAIRIPRARSADATRPVRIPVSRPPPGPATTGPPSERRQNRAGTQRALRLTLLYVTSVAVLFAAFALAAETTPAGSSSGAAQDLLLFGLVALLIGGTGSLFVLGSTPRAIELTGSELVVVGRFGQRLRFSLGPTLSVRRVRRYGASFLSSSPVEAVELSAGGVRRTFVIEEGILPEPLPTPTPAPP
jgi:hypothetical protein